MIKHLNTIDIADVNIGNIKYLLKEPIELLVMEENGLKVVVCKELDIYTYSYDLAEAIDKFKLKFHSLWEELSTEMNENLTRNAIKLKKAMQGIVTGVCYECTR